MNEITLEDIIQNIKEDRENGFDVSIISENKKKHCIRVYDNTDTYSREYTLYDPRIIDHDWIKSKIICCPSTESLSIQIDTEALSLWLYKNLKAEMLTSLKNIVFIGDSEADQDWLCGLSSEWKEQFECSSLPGFNQLGITWWEGCKVFVDINYICQLVEEMIDDGMIDSWDEKFFINKEIAITTLHELRHLMMSNPYIPENIINRLPYQDDETDAEYFASTVYNSDPTYILKEVSAKIA